MLEPYSNNILKRVVKTPKVYFYDTGLVCYLARWTSADTTMTGAQSGNIYENFIVSEILKSHLEDGKLYPIEIKMTGNPTKSMGKHFSALKDIPNKEVQPGIILCQYERKTYLTEDIIALSIEYI